MVRYIRENEVRQLLSMPLALDCVERALTARAQGKAIDIARERTKCAPAIQHVLQAAAPELGVIGFKAYVVTPRGKTFHVNLYDLQTGALKAMIEADWMGRWRTGAASGVATRHLAKKNASVLGQIGAGRQAGAQFIAVCAVRKIREARVYSRTPEKLKAFCREMSAATGVKVIPARSGPAALAGADVVNIITKSSTPVIEADWISPGAHINAAGSNSFARAELDVATIERCNLIAVDSRNTARKECGDLMPLVEEGRLDWDALPEIGEIMAGLRPGRRRPSDITLYESHGMGIQDIYLCVELLKLAKAQNLGIDLPIGA